MTNVTENELTVVELGYSVNLPITAVYGNKAISNVKPETKIDGAQVENEITKCNISESTSITTDTNKYTEYIANHTENEQSVQFDKKASPKIVKKTMILLFYYDFLYVKDSWICYDCLCCDKLSAFTFDIDYQNKERQ